MQIDFYTVPQVDVFARDSQGGYFGTIGQMTDLEANAPICYIDKSKQCFLVSENGIAFLENAQSWRMYLQECDEVKIYDSKEDAMKELDFLNLDEFL